MSMYAKQSTAKTFIVGPILDSAGVAKTDEVVGSIKVSKNGTVGAANGSTTLTHDHTGHYKLACATGDLDTLGEVEFTLNSGTNAMAPVKFQVVPAMVYDSLVLGTDTLQSDLVQVDGTANASATLQLKKIEVNNSTGNAVEFISTGSNGNGFTITGHGTGEGAKITAGATGNAIEIIGGSTSGQGVYITTTSGNGMYIEAYGVSAAGVAVYSDVGSAMYIFNGSGSADLIFAANNGSGDALSALIVADIQAGLAIESKQPSATAATNMTAVYDTDFSANYDATNDKWKLDQVTLAKYIGLLARSDSAIVTDLTAELALINTDYTSGIGDYAAGNAALEGIGVQAYGNYLELVNGTYGLSAILTQGNAAWITATGFSTHSAADVVTALGTGSSLTDLATQTSVNTIDDFLDTEIAAIKAKTDSLTFTTANKVDAKLTSDGLDTPLGNSTAAAKLGKSADSILTGTVDNTAHTPTTTVFECDDITEATADHYKNRVIIFTSGALVKQVCSITAYSLQAGRGRFTVSVLTEAPANNDTLIIV